jgi:hypothetical protein
MPQGAKGASLRIRLPYRSDAELISGLGPNLTSTTLFVTTDVVRPTGTIVALQLVDGDGRRVLNGEAVVAKALPRARPGMLLRFLSLDGESRAFLDRAYQSPDEQAERLVLGVDAGTIAIRLALAIDGRPGLVTRALRDGSSDVEALRAALVDARDKLGLPVTRAVFAVPAYFTERQRAAVSERAQSAGWRVERTVSAPSALAIAFAAGRGLPRRRLLVVDLGASKLDIGIVEVEGDDVEVVACGGDSAFAAASTTDAGLLDRLDSVVRGVLSGASLTAKALDGLVLGGGLAHLPAVRERLQQRLGRAPVEELDPDTAGCFGAALLGDAGAGWNVSDLLPEEPVELLPAAPSTEALVA